MNPLRYQAFLTTFSTSLILAVRKIDTSGHALQGACDRLWRVTDQGRRDPTAAEIESAVAAEFEFLSSPDTGNLPKIQSTAEIPTITLGNNHLSGDFHQYYPLSQDQATLDALLSEIDDIIMITRETIER
ncbi:MAG: hypothetical protein HOO99_01005 [Hyphomicrobiaceae bacterium]|nr:hypothetical protein [Hyphomicrobiaceae bacterium]